MRTKEIWQLKQDVVNPKPDRRSKHPFALPVWPAGSIILVVRNPANPNVPEDVDLGYVSFLRLGPDDTNVKRYSGIGIHSEQVTALLAAEREPAPFALFMMSELYYISLDWILAMIVERGLVSIDAVRSIAQEIRDSADDDPVSRELEAAIKKHGL